MRHDSISDPSAGGRRDRGQPILLEASWTDDVLKRALDVIAAATLLVLLTPIILIVAVAIKLDSRGPVFYRCRRVGRFGADLPMLKFRKMYDGATGSALVSKRDERFTRMGPFLARTKLDEVPQLWNVLKGQMSLVGPRPEDPSFIALHPKEYEEILSVRPGVTGYCQLAFARETEILDDVDRERHYVERMLPQKVALDRLYVAGRSFLGDLKVLWWTAKAVLFGREVAVHRRTGRLGRRMPRASVTYVAEHVPERIVA